MFKLLKSSFVGRRRRRGRLVGELKHIALGAELIINIAAG